MDNQREGLRERSLIILGGGRRNEGGQAFCASKLRGVTFLCKQIEGGGHFSVHELYPEWCLLFHIRGTN